MTLARLIAKTASPITLGITLALVYDRFTKEFLERRSQARAHAA